MRKILLAYLSSVCLLQAATVAILDTHFDIQHQDLVDQLWANPGEIPDNGKDDDGNGRIDDIHGWNFIQNNSELMDYSYLDSVSERAYQYYEVISKSFLAHAEIEWLRDLTNDPQAMEEVGNFGGFIHGTHLAGIVAQHHTVLPFKVSFGPLKGLRPNVWDDGTNANNVTFWMEVAKIIINQITNRQMNDFRQISHDLEKYQIEVAVMSMGMETDYAKTMLRNIFDGIVSQPFALSRNLSREELNELADYIFYRWHENVKQMMALAPDTLFIFPAGNGHGLDITNRRIVPGEVKAPNSMTVAASLNQFSLATFSNYSREVVELAAFGINIQSSVPINRRLPISGTSQAAPTLANVAGQIKDINFELSSAQVREILIQTVDRRLWLKDKLISSGILHEERAREAARLSLAMTIADACDHARRVLPQKYKYQ